MTTGIPTQCQWSIFPATTERGVLKQVGLVKYARQDFKLNLFKSRCPGMWIKWRGEIEGERRQQWKLHRRFMVDILQVYRYIRNPVLMVRTPRMENNRHSQHHSMSQNVIYKSGWISSISTIKNTSLLLLETCPTFTGNVLFSNWGSMTSEMG